MRFMLNKRGEVIAGEKRKCFCCGRETRAKYKLKNN